MAAIGKKLWKPVAPLSRYEPGHGGGILSRSQGAEQRTYTARTKQDRSVRVPSAAAVRAGFSQYLRRCPAGDDDSLQLACRREPDRAAVGGPKRKVGAFGSS